MPSHQAGEGSRGGEGRGPHHVRRRRRACPGRRTLLLPRRVARAWAFHLILLGRALNHEDCRLLGRLRRLLLYHGRAGSASMGSTAGGDTGLAASADRHLRYPTPPRCFGSAGRLVDSPVLLDSSVSGLVGNSVPPGCSSDGSVVPPRRVVRWMS